MRGRFRRISILVACSLAFSVVVAPAAGLEGSVVLQGFGGAAFNLSTPLTLEHATLGAVEVQAHWETRPMDQPFYWAIRGRWQRRDDGFELQLLHHKMYLENTSSTIEHFEVTHGFNVLTVNYLRRTYPVQPRIGLGVVIPHAESIVDGQYHGSEGYSIGGPAVMIGAGWEQALGQHVLVAADTQFIAGWATVDIDGGTARVRSLALHVLVGLGLGF